jgi:septal ring factor EnvC (AmiA/AmiB activator)
MTQFSSELRALKATKEDLQKHIDSLELEAKKVKVNIAKIEKDRTNAEEVCRLA